METDWREILKFSQKELKQTEKDKLCESLSWMEVDDDELNYADLKTLFKLSQDILKYKSEQINGMLGKLQKPKRKVKTKESSTLTDSPALSSDSIFDTMVHQEEVIKANKNILEQLYEDISKLEQRKTQYMEEVNKDQSSESSRGTLSELNVIAQLENEVSKRNKHIRKLLGDVKILEEENTTFKAKLTIFKEKLKEATLFIENLTEQLFVFKSDHSNLKEVLARTEEEKTSLIIEIESLRNELNNNNSEMKKSEEDNKYKFQRFKDLLKSHRAEIDRLTSENTQLKEDLISKPVIDIFPHETKLEEIKVMELQDKLKEASEEILKSAHLIKILTNENKHYKLIFDDLTDNSVSEQKNECDDGKQKNKIDKLKKKVKNLCSTLQDAEEMAEMREKEVTELMAQLKLLRSDKGVSSLIEDIKNKTRHLRIKDEGNKSLVQEVNALSRLVSELELENTTMRQKLQIPENEKIMTHGILKGYRDLKTRNTELTKQLQQYENKLIALEIDCYDKTSELQKLKSEVNSVDIKVSEEENNADGTSDLVKTIIEENEGLRDGLTEILSIIKDNSHTTSGILSMECPSLEAVLNSMEARKSAGWFSPHMRTVMELKTAIGAKDALINALNESSKETFRVMKRLTEEEQKSCELEKAMLDKKATTQLTKKTEDKISSTADINIGDFGSWMTNKEYKNIEFTDSNQIQNLLNKGNILFENHFIQALKYFQNKFTILFDKFTSLTIAANDNSNRWVIQEEQYKAEIENLRSQINEDDISNLSPGLLDNSKFHNIDRKYHFLEESFKQIRTLNENIKNEYLESRKERMNESFDYERKIQKLIISLLDLSDKLRDSLPVKLFLKQNETFNQLVVKYRNVIENNYKHTQKSDDFTSSDDNKFDTFHVDSKDMPTDDTHKRSIVSLKVKYSILQKQFEQTEIELHNKNKEIDIYEKKLSDLQMSQAKIIDKVMSLEECEEIEYIKKELHKLEKENKLIKDQEKYTQNKLDNLIVQVQANEQTKLNNEIEINMLRHQILDLQSSGDNKAIIARLSGEILLVQLQSSEIYERMESLKIDIRKEKQLRAETEEILMKRQKVFDIYSKRCDKKFRIMNDIIEILRHQYAGSLPLISIETFLSRFDEFQLKSQMMEVKLNDIEDLRLNLMTKHSIFSQILDLSHKKCFEDEDSCPHKLQNFVMEATQKLELDNNDKKLLAVEKSHKKLIERCGFLERALILVNQGFKNFDVNNEHRLYPEENKNSDFEDIKPNDVASSTGSLTYTVANNREFEDINTTNRQIPTSTLSATRETTKNQDRQTQTANSLRSVAVQSVQTEDDLKSVELNSRINKLVEDERIKDKLLQEANLITNEQASDLLRLNKEKNVLLCEVQSITNSFVQKEEINKNLVLINDSLQNEIAHLKVNHLTQINTNETVSAENQLLLENLKKIEKNKNDVILEYKELLEKERQEHLKSIRSLQLKLSDLQAKIDEKQTEVTVPNDNVIKETNNKYTLKICDLESKCFKLLSDLEGLEADLKNQKSELERWKNLASERLIKMEQLSAQLKERHNHEMESYKAENEHWLTQLNETQREHMELRSRLSDQKAFHLKQLSEKDTHIEQLRSVINNLKTQVLSMQTMLTINDPTFDLSAIVEVDEVSDAVSQQGSDRLELKFESSVDLHELQDDLVRIPSSSTAIWQEPLIDRLRREKQLIGKQNTILRRQIKVLAARERRSRLDAQNLKNQVFRITTNGNKVPSAESAALQNKIASLQAQLTSARREAHSSVALWDKWKRAQQMAERWQAKYEEKCQEIKKIEVSLNLSKSAAMRLEKEKRVLLLRLGDLKHEKSQTIEKQDAETSEKALSRSEHCFSPPPVSARALLDRVEAQQRRIAALELAEKLKLVKDIIPLLDIGLLSSTRISTLHIPKELSRDMQGNETLVSEYEKCLAEISSLKGQVLKLESTLLEAQIRMPLKAPNDTKPELDYWRNYCNMLKEENMQLTLRVNSLENIPTSASQQRISDLEQTILTLRGLVSKLQADQKSSTGAQRRIDSRPGSGRSGSEKARSQLESCRVEISNLKRSILEKDALLESSKEMLKIAAEREDELLKENILLRRRLEELTESNRGPLSA